jgi:hypothetical protein
VSLREHLAKEWGHTDEDPFEVPKEGNWLIVQTLAGGDGSDTYAGLADAFKAATTKARANDDEHIKNCKAELQDVMELIKAADERLAQLLILAGDLSTRVTAKSASDWDPYDKVLVEPRIGQEPTPLERATPSAWREPAVTRAAPQAGCTCCCDARPEGASVMTSPFRNGNAWRSASSSTNLPNTLRCLSWNGRRRRNKTR